MKNNTLSTLLAIQSLRKTPFIVRVLSVPLSLLILIVFSDTLHHLIHQTQSLESTMTSLCELVLFAILFWLFSYVAIKGKSPKYWHPYQ